MAVKALLPIAAAAAGSTALRAAVSGGRRSSPAPTVQAPLPSVTRDVARESTAQRDELRRRRGTAADIILGPQAGEVMGVGMKSLTGE